MKKDIGGGVVLYYDGRKAGECIGCGVLTTRRTNEFYKFMRDKLNKGLLCPLCTIYESYIFLNDEVPQEIVMMIEESRIKNK